MSAAPLRAQRIRRPKALQPPPPPSSKLPEAVGFRHREEFPTRSNAEHASAADLVLLAKRNQVIEQRARHLGPEIAANMQIGLEAARLCVLVESKSVTGPGGDPFVHVGPEDDIALVPVILLGAKLDREEWRIQYCYSHLLHRRDQKIFIAFPLEHR